MAFKSKEQIEAERASQNRDMAIATSPANLQPSQTSSTQVVASSDDALAAYIGAGYENVQRTDFAMPFLSIVQGMSTKILEKVPAAKPGMIINSTTNDVYPGVPGVEIIPCYTDHRYVHRKAQVLGGGFIDSYPLDAPIVKQVKSKATEFGKFYFDYANPTVSDRLIETYYVYGLQMIAGSTIGVPELRPVLQTFKSKSIPVYKGFMQSTAGNMIRDPRSHRLVTGPLFGWSYQWKIVKDTGQGQEFFNWAYAKGRKVIADEPAFGESVQVYNAARIGLVGAAADPDDELPF